MVKCSLCLGKKFPSKIISNIYKVGLSPGFYCLFVVVFLPSGSPSVSNLEYDSQSRTLTCTSTGGPATTVTWKRDEAVITPNATHQQTKRVVGLVMSTYQTVLTIDPSVDQSDIPGLYYCAVENNRGTTSKVLVVPGRGELIS